MSLKKNQMLAIMGAVFLVAACDLGFKEDSTETKTDDSLSSSAVSAASSSSGAPGGGEWSEWIKGESPNTVSQTMAVSIDEANSTLVLSQSRAHCENGLYEQEDEIDTLRYLKNTDGMLIWGTKDCRAMQFKGENAGIQGKWTLAGDVEIPGGTPDSCDGKGPGEFDQMSVDIQAQSMVLNGKTCPTRRIQEMFGNPELQVEVVDCNRAKIFVAGKSALVRIEQNGMDGMGLRLWADNKECKLDAMAPTDASMCTQANDPWMAFGKCVSELALPLWGNPDNNMDMNGGMKACHMGDYCYEGAAAANCEGGHVMDYCPAPVHLICPTENGKVFVYDTSKQDCSQI